MQATRLFTILVVSVLFSATADSLEAQTITHVPLYTFIGEDPGTQFGHSVSGAGDVNGDGFADVIVGASGGRNSGNFLGSARVFSGSDGSILYSFNGDDLADEFGFSVSGAGDVNGDGFADVIVGAERDDNNGTSSGSARVFSGIDGSVLYSFDGDGGDFFGHSVSGAGDVNGDEKDDLIVGSVHGGARVLSGSDGSVLHSFDGEDPRDWFGWSVSSAGDVNGDGTPDLIIGGPRIDNDRGNARVLSGSDGSVLLSFDGDTQGDEFGFSVSSVGDVNGDGTPDMIVGAPLDRSNSNAFGSARVLSGSDGSILYNFFDENSNGGEFGYSVSGVGDVNGDGTPDMIVGTLESSRARVLSGSDGSTLYNFNGDSSADFFGDSVSGAGDINGDGIDDFIIGAPGRNYARVFVSAILGDCNQDGVVNFLDISPFISILSAGDYLGQADTNQDGVVDFLDISPFIALLSL